jgi:hypothetical protein
MKVSPIPKDITVFSGDLFFQCVLIYRENDTAYCAFHRSPVDVLWV